MNALAGILLVACLALLEAAAAGQSTINSKEGKLAYNGIGTGYTTVLITPSSGYGGAPLAMRILLTELESPPHLSLSEQALMQQIFQTCCSAPDSCLELRQQTVNGQPSMDLCSACRECICNDKGNLVQIHWEDYRLSCPFPAAMLGAFPRLQFLRLRNNPGLTGEYESFAEPFRNRSMIMFEIEGSPNITGQLASNGTDGACLMAERGLGTLTVKHTGVSGPLPACIFSPRMAQLYLDNNALNGTIPDAFEGAPLLNLFQVDHNQLTGTLPPSAAAARVLQELYLNANQLSGALPDLFGENEALVFLDVTNNSLSGPWPASLANHSTAAVVRAGLNRFGTLPPQLAELPISGGSGGGIDVAELPLKELDLSYNNLTGEFPTALALMPNLEGLNITGNHLSGPLPDEPDMFPRSHRLLMGTNNFSGPLPDSWNDTNVISGRVRTRDNERLVFNASWNQLTGPVPAWLAAAATHDTVDVSNNSFSDACTNPDYVSTPGICLPLPSADNGYASGGAAAALAAPAPPAATAALAWLALITIPVLALAGLAYWMYRRREQRRILRSLAAAHQQEDGPVSPAHSGSQESSGLVVAPWSDTMLPRSAISLTKGPNGKPLLLGQGGFGTVYRGTLFSEPVAVKVIPTGSALVNTEAILREVAILKACHSTYIVGFRGACVHEGDLYLVTELMQGGDLWTALHSGRITWYNRGHQIALDVARGLAYLHEHRVIHMNVLLTAQGVARIADIGLAGILSTTRSYIASSAVAVGTIAYCSPEQLLGLKCGFASDIYSFGVLLHEIATQATPVRGRMRPIRVPEEAPAEVVGLINLCMRSEAKERPTAPQIVSQLKLIRRRMLRAPDTARLMHAADSGSVEGTLGSASSGGGGAGCKPGSKQQASGGSGGGTKDSAAAAATAEAGQLEQNGSLEVSSSKEGALEQADSLALSKEASGSLPLSKETSGSLPISKGAASTLPLIKGGDSS
ncbi:serine threonine- kinase [Chlorella sorokiniana]|uniref:Serine threonine-kinase n=1 Tax=Chlorella sorokiniana TaxID=3076 RepID=A0A2P6U1T1_CHLSO|nr:serine threonine- kinase [Chlorella sorokiniana]|eukprot:PRW60272.1 serine threonine- kinase [Chlorella sorokiniana]